jgi:hypothetical protein
MAKRIAAGTLALATLGLSTCTPRAAERGPAPACALRKDDTAPGSPPRARPPAVADAAVLVVIDGVRWQDVEGGAGERFPNMRALATREGASLEGIAASGPNFVSLPGYTEIFTGRAGACRDNECPPICERTIADELAARGEGVAVFASWERLANAAAADRGRIALSTGRSLAHGVDEDLLGPGRAASAYPGDGDFRPDRFTARAALTHLERHRPTFLFLGLGEPDEYAHKNDRPGYLAALRSADATIGDLRATLARMGERGAKTAVFVTTDHGRADGFTQHGGAWPESARVWLVAGGAGVRARGVAGAAGQGTPARRRALADVAPTVRTLLGLAEPAARSGAGRPLDELL